MAKTVNYGMGISIVPHHYWSTLVFSRPRPLSSNYLLCELVISVPMQVHLIPLRCLAHDENRVQVDVDGFVAAQYVGASIRSRTSQFTAHNYGFRYRHIY